MILVPEPETAQPGETIRAKWMWDDAATLEEAAQLAEEAAARLRALAAAGWTLAEPVRDDYGFLIDPNGYDGRDEDE